jgi:adenylosuccinate synthase
MSKAFRDNKKFAVEGANALLPDIDYGSLCHWSKHQYWGCYCGACTLSFYVKEIIGVIEVYTGSVPFPTELSGVRI